MERNPHPRGGIENDFNEGNWEKIFNPHWALFDYFFFYSYFGLDGSTWCHVGGMVMYMI
jgi:hypothetical protein